MARTYDRFLRQRLSRRRLLAGASGTALGAAALAACGGGGSSESVTSGTPAPSGTATPAPEVITKDGVLHGSHTTVLPSLNVFGAAALGSALTFGFSVFDHLWYVPLDTQEVELFLATNIENPDEMGLEIIVSMQEAFFHDKPPVNGRQVLASDVKASYDAFAADTLAPGHGWFNDFMESVEAPDDLTVIIRQKRPYAWVFHSAGAGSPAWSSILPEETLPTINPDGTLGDGTYDLSKDLIGSGRLKIVENRSGEFFRLERHDKWRVEGEPFLAAVESSLITEPALRQAAFRARDLDSVPFSNKLESDQMVDQLGDDIYITSDLSRSYHTIQLSLKDTPFDNINVRKAVRLAINRQDLILGVSAGDPEGGVFSGPVPPTQSAFAVSEEEEYFRHDPAEARALLEEAAFPFDREFTLKYPSSETQEKRATLLKEQFGAVGIKVRIEGEDLLTKWLPQTLQTGAFEMTSYTQLPYDDPTFPLVFYTTHSALGAEEPRGRNNMDFYDEEITAAADAVDAELNVEARNELVKDAVRLIMAKEAPMINLYSSVTYTARWNWYKGLVIGRGSYGGFNGRSWIDTALRGS